MEERKMVELALKSIKRNAPESVSNDELSSANYLIGYLKATISLHLRGEMDLRDSIERDIEQEFV